MTIDLDRKLAFLRSQGTLDHVVECVETHMAWVFLTEHRALEAQERTADLVTSATAQLPGTLPERQRVLDHLRELADLARGLPDGEIPDRG